MQGCCRADATIICSAPRKVLTWHEQGYPTKVGLPNPVDEDCLISGKKLWQQANSAKPCTFHANFSETRTGEVDT